MMKEDLLPSMVKDLEAEVMKELQGVDGVALAFDLWMSRKTEDVLSLDMHFITPAWEWKHRHVGLLSCSDSTSGPAIIGSKLSGLFKRFNLQSRIFAIVKDGGANLKTATQTLQDYHTLEEVHCCAALAMTTIWVTICMAHMVNNACNSAVLKVKNDTKFTVRCPRCLDTPL